MHGLFSAKLIALPGGRALSSFRFFRLPSFGSFPPLVRLLLLGLEPGLFLGLALKRFHGLRHGTDLVAAVETRQSHGKIAERPLMKRRSEGF